MTRKVTPYAIIMPSSPESITKALGLINAGRLGEAEILCRKIAANSPGRADVQHLLAVLAMRSGEFETASKMAQNAVEIAPQSAEYRHTLGIVQRQLGEREAATRSIRNALELAPGTVSIGLNLIDCLHSLERWDEAAPLCQDFLRREPRNPQCILAQGNQFLGEKRMAEAIEVLRRCTVIAPKFGFGLFRLATAYAMSGQWEAAVSAFEAAVKAEPANKKFIYHLSIALLNAGRAKAAIAACDKGLCQEPNNVRLLSIKVIALQRAGVSPGDDILAEWESLIRPGRISTPLEFETSDDFNEALLTHIRAHPSLTASPPGNATRYGDHTGELMVEPKGPLTSFELAVGQALDSYQEAVLAQPVNAFIRNRPPKLRLAAWSVLMRSGGHQVPHIHPSSWLSGVYYVAIPPSVSATDPEQAGWIEFGRPGTLIAAPENLPVTSLKPEEGLMVLFPSYLYHRTIPFHDTRIRVCIAFDLVPVNSPRIAQSDDG